MGLNWREGKMNQDKDKILNRLRSIEGHVRGVMKMVEDGAYCIDVVNQINAVQAALQKINTLVLDKHLHTCVTTAIRGDDLGERERVIDEIIQVYNARAKN
jgi:DNA-binding FrmR family transcriptional regulator